MEVHHHSHSPRKKWTHYFWEFLMLFLAVFCGFMAENFRESLIIKEKAHHYIENMVADLKSDIKSFDTATYYSQIWADHLDSATKIPIESLRDANAQASFLQHFYPYYSWLNYVEQTDNTIAQLKAGGFNLIHDKETVDSINIVYGYYKGVKFTMDYSVTAYWDVLEKAHELMKLPTPAVVVEDALKKFIPHKTPIFIKFDETAIQQLYNKLENAKGTLLTAIMFQSEYCKKAKRLLAYLKEKYRVK